LLRLCCLHRPHALLTGLADAYIGWNPFKICTLTSFILYMYCFYPTPFYPYSSLTFDTPIHATSCYLSIQLSTYYHASFVRPYCMLPYTFDTLVHEYLINRSDLLGASTALDTSCLRAVDMTLWNPILVVSLLSQSTSSDSRSISTNDSNLISWIDRLLGTG